MNRVVRLSSGSVEAVVRRAAEVVRGGVGAGVVVDAAELARRLQISRSAVYERADEVGG